VNPSEKRERFRALLKSPDCTFAAEVFDPISARIAEDFGFKAGMLSGSVASMTVLGAPDLSLLTLTEFADQARRICRASALPLLVDADHGFGNALNVGRTVAELEWAGVAALTIEDTALPAPFGADAKALIAVAEGEGKIRAAVAARQDPNLVIIGRTAAARIANIAEAVERAKAYTKAGADAMFFSGIRTRDQVETLHNALSLPILLGSGPAELSDRAYLAGHGVRVRLQGHRAFLASVRACYETLKELSEGVPPERIANTASSELMARVTRKDDYDAWIRNFLNA
jgi:carboxyvinyl-carboxyphosphonate phosphorylmutase